MRTPMVEAPAASATIDGYRVLAWSIGDVDVLLFSGETLIHQLPLPHAEAEQLAEWLTDRLAADPMPLCAVLAAVRAAQATHGPV
jgi:hypothetical protein